MVELKKAQMDDQEVGFLDGLLDGAGERMLFEDRPIGLNALFRFQLCSNCFDGHSFAREAWKRINADNSASVANQSLASLRKQKDVVKKELKVFEDKFAKFYGRPPSRLDKECLRRLYEYHKQLKSHITIEEARSSGVISKHPSPTNNTPLSPSSKLPPVSISGSIVAAPPKPDIFSSPLSELNREIKMAHVSKDAAANGNDLRMLRAEKRTLKLKLRKFEDDFIRKHGHKPQSYHEVGSIKADYARYKYLKEAVGS